MESKPRVGVIGAGAMGAAVVQRLLNSGFAVSVRDIRAEAEEEAAAAGAASSSASARMSRTDTANPLFKHQLDHGRAHGSGPDYTHSGFGLHELPACVGQGKIMQGAWSRQIARDATRCSGTASTGP